MYSINIEPPNEQKQVIHGSMCAKNASDLLPLVIAICEAEFNWLNAVALYMGDGVYRVMDLDHPFQYAKVTILNK